MKATIDADGRLLIPEEIRKQAGLKPGMEIELRLVDGHVEIELPPSRVRLVHEGPFLVAVPEGEAEPLTNEMVNDLIDEIRRERDTQILGFEL